MHPDKLRMGSNYVYTTPVIKVFQDGVEHCVNEHNAELPTIHDIQDVKEIQAWLMIETNGKFVTVANLNVWCLLPKPGG